MTTGPDFAALFEVVTFYEDAAGRVKTRTWAIAAWVYSVNSALIAFAVARPLSEDALFPSMLAIWAACLAGVALSLALIVLLVNQGDHLRGYMAIQHRAVQQNPELGHLIEIGAPVFPGFCRHLIGITLLYLAGFLGIAGWAAVV